MLVVIHTDGEENASQHATLSGVKELIEQKRREGWEFAFMGAGVDRWVGTSMGIPMNSTFTYDHTVDDHAQGYRVLATATANFASSGGATAGKFFDNTASKAAE